MLSERRFPVSRAEEIAARSLRAVLSDLEIGARIDQSDDWDMFLSAAERFVPDALSEACPEWHDAFDGFHLHVSRKIAPLTAELIGLVLLIDDQTWTPIWLRVRALKNQSSIEWIDCKVGERDSSGHGMLRLPYNSTRIGKLSFTVGEHPESVRWLFWVETESGVQADAADEGHG